MSRRHSNNKLNEFISSADVGLWAEFRVAQHFVRQRWELIAHQERTNLAEVDLVLRRCCGSGETRQILVEVKSLRSEIWLEHRYLLRQRCRLSRLVEQEVAGIAGPWELALATVSQEGVRIWDID